MRIFLCNECRQVVKKIGGENNPITCCKQEMVPFQKMNEIVGDDDSKHTPIIRQVGNFITITIENNHPMIDVHHIEFIMIETNQGFLYKRLSGLETAETEFILAENEEIINVFANCNVHSIFSI